MGLRFAVSVPFVPHQLKRVESAVVRPSSLGRPQPGSLYAHFLGGWAVDRHSQGTSRGRARSHITACTFEARWGCSTCPWNGRSARWRGDHKGPLRSSFRTIVPAEHRSPKVVGCPSFWIDRHARQRTATVDGVAQLTHPSPLTAACPWIEVSCGVRLPSHQPL